ncbi:fumarate hydratase [candidate division WOR-3 bacterium]|nr:fumarate hydratase [candidate division WOR-3 bacterium]
MRLLEKGQIESVVFNLCERNSQSLSSDVKAYYEKYLKDNPKNPGIIKLILDNNRIAQSEKRPLCQDTGVVCVFADIGTGVILSGVDIENEINEGVRRAGEKGILRKSMVSDFLTGNNSLIRSSPASVYVSLVEGDNISLTVLLKGGGSENSGRSKMFLPDASENDMYEFVEETVRKHGLNACPPLIIGIGTGGTADRASFLSLKSLLRDLGTRNPDPGMADIEMKWLEKINSIGIGPAGFGGRPTALDLFIETFPRHISTYPVSVSFLCCAARKARAVI